MGFGNLTLVQNISRPTPGPRRRRGSKCARKKRKSQDSDGIPAALLKHVVEEIMKIIISGYVSAHLGNQNPASTTDNIHSAISRPHIACVFWKRY